MSPLRASYLALSVLGAAWSLARLAPWRGWADRLAVEAPIAAAARALDDPLPLAGPALAFAAFALWVIAETRIRRNWPALLAIPGALALGLPFALPFYLFLRTRPIR